ncbi:3277_t:CDS:2, partial [Scutellospora calospora]
TEIVKLSEDKMGHLNEMLKKTTQYSNSINTITPKLVCNSLKINPNILDSTNEKSHETAFQLLTFIIDSFSQKPTTNTPLFRSLYQNPHYKQLLGIRLLPLCDKSIGTFGSQTYYMAKPEIRVLFPKVQGKFVADLPLNLRGIFKDEEFCNVLKIKQLDANSVIDLLESVLPRDKEVDWDPLGKQYPNKFWIDKIIAIFTAPEVNYDFNKLARFPILSITKPYRKLVLPDLNNPLLIYVSHPMVSILTKFGVRYTDMKISDNYNIYIGKCIAQPTAINMIVALEKAIQKSSGSLQQIFTEKLTQDDLEKFRTFIKDEFKHNKNENLKKFVKRWPIWPTQSRSTCISAQEGILPPRDIPFFSIQEETNIFLVESDSDFNTLFHLGAKYVEPVEYIKVHLNPRTVTPDQQYITFLKTVLALGKVEIEHYLSPLKIIANYDLELVKANTLYDLNESLFRRIFWNTGKLLHPDLQGNAYCLSALKRMGLKHQVTPVTFLECVHEVDSRIRRIQLEQSNSQIHLIKSDARFLMEYLYEHWTVLLFSPEQWQELISIKFVPVDTDLESPLKENAVETTGFDSINSMCYQEYKLLCWTQCPLFLRSIDPPNLFKLRYPELCRPSMSKILDNLCYVALDISHSNKDSSWRSPKGVQLIMDVLKETYKNLNEHLNVNGSFDNETRSRLQTDAKIFLNGNDPFIPEDWVAGVNLVFGTQEDIRTGLHKVHDNLKEFKLLLKESGAREIKDIKFNVKTQHYSQKDKLFGRLLDSFEKQEGTKHHDVEFHIHHENEIEKIQANRYVLS